jgi:succinyl-diaminopimelate desuccinylase
MTSDIDPLALTQALLRFDTINPPGQEQACAEHLGGLLEGAGFDVAYHAFADSRTSLVARLDGSGETPPLCFTGHIDTVPLGATPWQRDPFAGEVAEGRLYGRGSSDMKSGVAAFVRAAIDLARLGRPSAGLELVITAGEETGCEGAYYLARTLGALGRAGAVVVGEPSANYPFVGHKGALWLEARTHGVTAHGSMPEKGDNAVYKAAHAVTQLEQFGFNVAPHPELGGPTLNVGNLHGGMNINSVPDQAVIGIDVRTVPGQTHEGVRDMLAADLGDGVALDPLVDVEGVWTDPDDPWMRQVFAVMSDVLGETVETRAATYFTDASVLTPAYGGPPTVILGPGEPAMAHQTNEYCETDRLDEAVEAYSRIAAAWCGL